MASGPGSVASWNDPGKRIHHGAHRALGEEEEPRKTRKIRKKQSFLTLFVSFVVPPLLLPLVFLRRDDLDSLQRRLQVALGVHRQAVAAAGGSGRVLLER